MLGVLIILAIAAFMTLIYDAVHMAILRYSLNGVNTFKL